MAKKTKNKTFAQRALEIEKKYPRAKFDPIEKRDMEAELDALMQEQEAVRAQMGLNDNTQQFPYGGNLPTDFAIKSAIALGPTLRGQNLSTPLMNLTGMNPGVTEVDVIGSRNASVNRKYNQPSYTPSMDKPSKLVSTPEQEFLYNSASSSLPFNTGPGGYTIPQQNYRMGTDKSIIPSLGETLKQVGINKAIAGIGGTKASAAPPVNNTIPARDPMLTNTTRMQSIGTPRLVDNTTLAGNPKTLASKSTSQTQGKGKGFNTDMLPYVISGASNIIGNLLMSKSIKDRRIPNSFATPERVNFEPQAEQMRRDASVAKNVASVNARNAGLNSMQAMAGMSAAGSAVDRNLGSALTSLYGQQAQMNAGAANQLNSYNALNQSRANMANAQMQQRNDAMRLGLMEDALGTIPGVMKDIRADKKDAEMKNIMRQYYKSMGRNYASIGDIFSGKDGFQYIVREVDENGRITKSERV